MRTCKDYVHFDATVKQVTSDAAKRGKCRINPPASDIASGIWLGRWPLVSGDDWCGSWVGKPELKAVPVGSR